GDGARQVVRTASDAELPDELLNQRPQHRGSAVRLAVTAIVSAVVVVRGRSTESTQSAGGRYSASAGLKEPLILLENIICGCGMAGGPVVTDDVHDALRVCASTY